jgi:hypothetical protein
MDDIFWGKGSIIAKGRPYDVDALKNLRRVQSTASGRINTVEALKNKADKATQRTWLATLLGLSGAGGAAGGAGAAALMDDKEAAYISGFIDKCAEAGIDPEELVKSARGPINVQSAKPLLQSLLGKIKGIPGSVREFWTPTKLSPANQAQMDMLTKSDPSKMFINNLGMEKALLAKQQETNRLLAAFGVIPPSIGAGLTLASAPAWDATKYVGSSVADKLNTE